MQIAAREYCTDSKGRFQIKDLAPDLWFELLAVSDGYIPHFTKKVDPVTAADVPITLKVKPVATDLSGVVRGRVVDDTGSPIANAVVNPVGLIIGGNGNSGYGTIPGLDPIAVTNKNGEFEIAYAKPTPKMLLNIEARAMAPKFIVMETGSERHSVVLSEGASITGRLMANGKPVANAEIGVIPKNRAMYGADNLAITGDPYDETRIGTRPNGTFTITNLPEPVRLVRLPEDGLHIPAGSSKPRRSPTHPRQSVRQGRGDILIQPGHRLTGTVLLSDNKPIPDGMRITISSEKVWDSRQPHSPATATLNSQTCRWAATPYRQQ